MSLVDLISKVPYAGLTPLLIALGLSGAHSGLSCRDYASFGQGL